MPAIKKLCHLARFSHRLLIPQLREKQRLKRGVEIA